MATPKRYPIVVAGAGPVGLTIAVLLAEGPAAAHLRLRIVDPGAAPAWSGREVDLRVYALSRASQRVLERAGVWAAVASARASPYRRMCVWEGERSDGPGSLWFDCADIGEPDLGHIVEDALLRECLLERLRKDAGVAIGFGDSVESIETRPESIEIALGNGEAVSGALLVAADGGRSRIRGLLGIPVVERSYGQTALVTHVETERAHRETAWQRFLPGGPIALLPLADGRSSVVWSVADAEDRPELAGGDARLIEALEDASARVLGRILGVSERALFPLDMRHAREYCRHRAALVGDAAHTIHPLAGQGMNLGLLDAAAIVREIEQAVLSGADPGDLRTLRRYERSRKAANLEMLSSLDLLDRLFRLPASFRPLRMTGLGLVDRVVPAKRLLMRRALGLSVRPEGARTPMIRAGRE